LNSIYTKALLWLAGLAGFALVGGFIAGSSWGWAVFSAGLLAALGYHYRTLGAVARWLAKPLPEDLPEAHGSWDEVLRALHRHERDKARRHQLVADALARFRRAAQALPDGVVILDADNRIEWCNDTAARHLGLDARDDIGRPIGNLVRAPAFVEYLALPDPSAAGPIQVKLDRDDVYALQIVPYGDAEKLLLSRDVTQAERVETMRRDFVANVSHELRTPLTVLVGFLETVRELKLDAQRTRDYLSMMQGQAGRMQRIIEDLLTLSQLESSPPPASGRVSVMPLLERVRADAAALSGGRHTISLTARPELDLIGSDGELASAFGNLVTNAVRYTPEGGEIRIAWLEQADGAIFSVKDTGAGIAPEHLPRLTERFYRVDRSRSRETGGTGLGLAIVKHALARHQATLDVESKPGAGSTFSVRFPAYALRPLNPPRAQSGTPGPAPSLPVPGPGGRRASGPPSG
jgi:two-component system phosphate regulon sensor histidine kinase PhoR